MCVITGKKLQLYIGRLCGHSFFYHWWYFNWGGAGPLPPPPPGYVYGLLHYIYCINTTMQVRITLIILHALLCIGNYYYCYFESRFDIVRTVESKVISES